LKDETKLTVDQVNDLKTAERTLGELLPGVNLIFGDATEATNSLKIAREKLLEIDKKVLEWGLKASQLRQRQLEIDINIWEMEKDASARELDRLKEARKRAGEIIGEKILFVGAAGMGFDPGIFGQIEMEARGFRKWIEDEFKGIDLEGIDFEDIVMQFERIEEEGGAVWDRQKKKLEVLGEIIEQKKFLLIIRKHS